MDGDYKLLRLTGRRTFFAHVWVRSEPAMTSTVDESAVPFVRAMYGDALSRGIEAAVAAYVRRGGHACRVEVLRVLESAVDTTPDVVACAAAMAAWRSFGQDDAEAAIERGDEGWTVAFRSSAIGVRVRE